MKEKGFTLVELLAVIVILAIILAVAVPSIANIVNSATKGSFKSDAKMVLTAIDYEKLKDENFSFTTIDESNIADILKLSAANYESITVTVVDNKPYLVIVGKGKWAGFTAYGKTDNMRVVNSGDYDVTIPVITLIGMTPITIEAGSTYTDAGATASDDKDGDITSKMTISNTVNANVVRSYTVTYNVTDNNGNKADTVTRTVNVVDAAAPVITMLGTTPVTVIQNGIYSDAGATATDNVDGNITANIVTVSTVNTSIVGTYTVTYNVTDNAGNAAAQVTRTINVIDVTIPVITRNGASPVTVSQGATYTDAGATATDNVDGNITARIVVVNPVNTGVVGTYTVTYNVKDNANNSAVQVTRTVNVVYSTYTFASAGAAGQSGPTQAQLNTTYTGTSLAGTVTSASGIQTWTVPYTAIYRIEAYGAQGGTGAGYIGGNGARMRGDIALTAGQQLKILVGQMGESNASYKAAGGGGGTFVTLSNNSPLVIAGGGGGGGGNTSPANGYPGVITTTAGTGTGGGAAGTAGNGGGTSGAGNGSGGGGGLLTNGTLGFESRSGFAFVNGGTGGTKGSCAASSTGGNGGFGGGAGGEWCSMGAAGAGGGYSGGAGTSSTGVPGGGGSYNSGTTPSNTDGANAGNGRVVITMLP